MFENRLMITADVEDSGRDVDGITKMKSENTLDYAPARESLYVTCVCVRQTQIYDCARANTFFQDVNPSKWILNPKL